MSLKKYSAVATILLAVTNVYWVFANMKEHRERRALDAAQAAKEATSGKGGK